MLLEQTGIDSLVVDTKEKGCFTTTNRVASIAALLDANYYTIDVLKADVFAELIVNKEGKLN